jgi:prepilin-type N-terminal cleavage/methylation domain-containing protein
MMRNNKKGFTIIEVVLVLAIAGLIFLMVFIALPALQRSQRNTQRKNDLSRIATAAVSYASNNNGKTPFEICNGIFNNASNTGIDSSTDSRSNTLNQFILRYVVAGGDIGSQFSDPDGEEYMISCNGHQTPYQDLAVGDDYDQSAIGSLDHYIYAYVKSKCSAVEGHITKTSGSHDFSLSYRLEGGSWACADNQ